MEKESRVDVGHDDKTIIKLDLHFYLCNLPLLQTALLASLSHYNLSYAFKLSIFYINFLSKRKFFKTDIFIHYTNSPSS